VAKTKTKKRQSVSAKKTAGKKLAARKPALKTPVSKKIAGKNAAGKKRVPNKRAKPRGDGSAPVRTGIARLGMIIANAKRDLAALQAQEIGRTHLPSAGDELSAIVGATEAATNSILDAVERIEKTGALAGAEIGAAIARDATAIYEACNFQDITGQRISKIVSVLKEVDQTVAELLSTLQMPKIDLATSVPLAPPVRTGEAALLNGPQAPGGAPNQADIDALFDKL